MSFIHRVRHYVKFRPPTFRFLFVFITLAGLSVPHHCCCWVHIRLTLSSSDAVGRQVSWLAHSRTLTRFTLKRSTCYLSRTTPGRLSSAPSANYFALSLLCELSPRSALGEFSRRITLSLSLSLTLTLWCSPDDLFWRTPPSLLHELSPRTLPLVSR